MKILSGSEIAGYMKENQARQARSLRAKKVIPKLIILRDSDNPVIAKYVQLKRRYGDDIGVIVEDWHRADLAQAVKEANDTSDAHGIIVQMPLKNFAKTDEIIKLVAPEKDVDGLTGKGEFDSATATAINWLLGGYDIKLDEAKIAIVGQGRLVGSPLTVMWRNSGYDVTTFHKGDDLNKLEEFDVIVTATGVPHLIKNTMVKSGAVLVDAGTASEGGVLVGDVDDEIRNRSDLTAITPKKGGVGPLTVTALFEHVLIAAKNKSRN